VALVQLEDVAANGPGWESDSVADATRDNDYFVGAGEDVTELGLDVEDAVLEDDQEIAIGGIEGFVAHILTGGKYENTQAGFHGWVSSAAEVSERVHPVACLVHVKRVPAKLVRNLVEWCLQVVWRCSVNLATVCDEVAVGSCWEDSI
jgi:hypothetical protein